MTFLPNIYDINNGSTMRALDILRLISVLVIMFTGSVYFQREYEKVKKLPEDERSSLLELIFETNFFSDIYTLTLYLACFAIKITKLSVNLEQSIYFQNIKIENEPFYIENNFEFFNFVSIFESQIILECLLVFGCLFKIMNAFVLFKRVKVFSSYLINAFARVFSYFLLVFFLIISFSFFSNNLWGSYSEQYRDVIGSLTATLLLSIGHFNKEAFTSYATVWNDIYIFLFFMIFIYFITSSYVGIYIESFRLNSLKLGDGYDYRLLGEQQDDSNKKPKKRFWCF